MLAKLSLSWVGTAPHDGQAVRYCCLADLTVAWEETLEG